MDTFSLVSLIGIPAAAALAPLLSSAIGRYIRIPLVVFEIVLGLLIGPSILGWVQPTEFTEKLSDFGLAMLFFLAGNEIDFQRIRGRALNRSIVGWLLSLVAGVAVGLLIAPTPAAGVFVGIALTSTALGTLMPVLRDAGELRTPFGTSIIAIGAVGEFGPLIAISLFLSGTSPGVATVVLAAFVLITAGAIYLASRGTHHRLHALINATLHTSGQFAVRMVVLLLTSLVALSLALDLDMLLGAFAAGVIAKLLLADATPHDAEIIEGKVEALGFGFFVPVFLILLVLVRGLPGLLSVPINAVPADKRAIVLFCATGLPIIVAVTNIGLDSGDLPAGTAAALVGAGMLSVLLFPLLALGQHRQAPDGGSKAPDVDAAIDEEG